MTTDGTGPRAGQVLVREVVGLLVVPAAMAVLVLAVGLLAAALGDGVMETVTDPAALLDFPSWYGVLSTLGLFCWAAAATAALLGATDVRVRPDVRPWLKRVGALTVVLLLDDAFLLHEQVGAALGGGPGEALALLLLGLASVAAVVPGVGTVLRTPGGVLAVLGVVLLGTSVAVDLIESLVDEHTPVPPGLAAWGEEWLKLTGVATWATALVSLSRSGRETPHRAAEGRTGTVSRPE